MMRERPTTDELTRMTPQEAATISAREVGDTTRRALATLARVLFALVSHALPDRKRKARLLRPDEARPFMSVSRGYFYDHERELPFTCRIPGGQLRISEPGMLSWIEGAAERDEGGA